MNSPGDAQRINNSINNIILCRVNELTRVLNKSMEDNIAQSNAQSLRISMINQSITRISRMPERRFVGGETADGPTNAILVNNGMDDTACLFKCPKNLHVLWEEWTVGVGGFEAASLFS